MILGWGNVSPHSQCCQIAKVPTQILGFSVKEKHEEVGEESLNLGVLEGNNSACGEVKGLGWELRGLWSYFSFSYPEYKELLLKA